MKKSRIEEKKREILRKLNDPMVPITEQERNRLQDHYRKLINKSLRNFCKKSKR